MYQNQNQNQNSSDCVSCVGPFEYPYTPVKNIAEGIDTDGPGLGFDGAVSWGTGNAQRHQRQLSTVELAGNNMQIHIYIILEINTPDWSSDKPLDKI